jgi:hypothetical protein
LPLPLRDAAMGDNSRDLLREMSKVYAAGPDDLEHEPLPPDELDDYQDVAWRAPMEM